jgi:adenosylcobinamide-GDP ribazoletransferase
MWNDIKVAAAFLTRIPISHGEDVRLQRSALFFPVIGLLIGALGGLAYFIAASILPPLPAAALATLACVAITGAFHLDGLADICDGLVGGWNREDRLRILKDSRHGTYGVVAIVLQLLLQVSLLATLPPIDGALALTVAHCVARVVPIALMLFPAAPGQAGMGASVAREVGPRDVVLTAALASLIALPIAGVQLLAIYLLLGAAMHIFSRWVLGKIDGVVGDAFGAGEQIAETLVLLYFAVVLSTRGQIPWML